MATTQIERIATVGDGTIALELTTPTNFEAYPGQFIQVQAEVGGEERSRYYTLSSPNAGETFEITVEVSPDGTLSSWLSNREVGDALTIEGPFGKIQYTGEEDVAVLASGPGIGPAVGIAERAHEEGSNATVVHTEPSPAHASRLRSLSEAQISILPTTNQAELVAAIDGITERSIYVFGFEEFVARVRTALTKAEIDESRVQIESFGPR